MINLENFYKLSVLIRETEKTLLNLFSQGRLNGTVHTCIGQEYVGALLAQTLSKGDTVFSNHRCHGHYIGRTNDVEGLLLEVMGSSLGAVNGVGGSQHLYHKDGFYSNGILGGMSPVAAGYAFTKLNSNNVVCLFLGDGASGEGVFYETLNLVSKFNLPIVILNENNSYSQSTARQQVFFGDMKKRVEGFGIDYEKVNIWDVENFCTVISKNIDKTRVKRTPIFIEIECYRLKAHSKGDDNRSIAEIKKYEEKDPINVFSETNKKAFMEFEQEAILRINSILDKNQNITNQISQQLPSPKSEVGKVVWKQITQYSSDRVNDLIYMSFNEKMTKNKDILVIGEDIEHPYGGAFKVTRDLSHTFENRVFNMPDSEQAIVGFGNGLSLGGKIPVCEIMFGDFLGLTFDQWLNHAAKFQKMYGDKFFSPIIIRSPMGGKRGYGPTHSQNIEKHFLGIPNTQIIVINPRNNPKDIYDTLLNTIKIPTLVIENKQDYARENLPKTSACNYEYYKNNLELPDLKYATDEDPDITIVCWGGLVVELEEIINDLTESEEIIVEMIVPTMIYPLRMSPIEESLLKTGKLLIVEDDTSFSSLGSEIISQLSIANFDFKAIKLNTKDEIIPSSKILEDKHYPTRDEIFNKMKELFLL